MTMTYAWCTMVMVMMVDFKNGNGGNHDIVLPYKNCKIFYLYYIY